MKKTVIIISIICLLSMIAATSAIYTKTPIGINSAEINATNFIDNSNTDIEYLYEQNYDIGEYYVFKTGNGQIYVNKYSGLVERASFSNAKETSKKVLIDSSESIKIGEEYAKEKYNGFEKMNMKITYSELLDHADAGYEYSYVWRESLNGVFTPNSVAIDINPESGEITSYIGIHREINCNTEPKVSEDKAITIAKEQFPQIKIKEQNCYLSIEYTKADTQTLTWVIYLEGEPVNDTPYGGLVIINAITGEVILESPLC
ncbi:hypothetical protein J2128_001824 [Methanomicrobium sp. W14]|uniref:PepSY domain-containing protein n=1 Tax=Methanomicrobium sp. W14 TaxID=2817839 RepID=UPI001AE51377|nr:PepSY domain-containing protein [Methanomicrobium sp. W14]MBP2133870.1 hypothetical protein [Methanomicrobium sp. W14]